MAAGFKQWVGLCLAAGAAGTLGAQALQTPAAEPVSLARGGAGVAFGRSLEAATLNPALLPTLQDNLSAYVALGEDIQSAQTTLQSNQVTSYTSDRNRALLGLGLAWKLAPNFGFGFKIDQSWRRQGTLPDTASGRFLGRSMDLGAKRAEAQLGWSPANLPQLSFGVGFGITRVSYQGLTDLRLRVAADPTQPISTTNGVAGMMEEAYGEAGSATRPSYTLGVRWAISTRWTLAATYESQVKGSFDNLSASDAGLVGYTAPDGFGPPPAGIEGLGQQLRDHSTVQAGRADFNLPARGTLGVRERVNNFFTWELDLRAARGGFRMPEWAQVQTPSGTVLAPRQLSATNHGVGFSLAGDVDITKRLTARAGIAYDPAVVRDEQLIAIEGGQRSAAFSIGAGYKIWKGEFNVGYQFRQSQDVTSTSTDAAWSSSGYRPTGTPVRIESMGHLFSFGYHFSF